MLNTILQAMPSQGISITGILVVIIVVFFILKILLRVLEMLGLNTILYRIAFYISRRNGTPGSSQAVLCLLMLLKSALKKDLKKKTYKSITGWNLVHEIANRYICSFSLYGHDFTFTVIADSIGSIDFQGLNFEKLEELNQR